MPPGPPGTKAFETLEFRLALGIYFAAIESAALGFVAENLIGGTHLGESFLRLGILALIRMVFFRQLAKRLLDFGRLRRFRYAQN